MDDRGTLLRAVIDGLSASSPNGSAALAGAIGGTVRWLVQRERLVEGFLSVLVGTACAWFLWPVLPMLIKSLFGLDITALGTDLVSVSGFLVGATGISLIRIIIRRVASEAKNAAPPVVQNAVPDPAKSEAGRPKGEARHLLFMLLLASMFVLGAGLNYAFHEYRDARTDTTRP